MYGENNDVLHVCMIDLDQSRCHWIMQLYGETADSCLCVFCGIDPYQCLVQMFTLFILVCALFMGKRIFLSIMPVHPGIHSKECYVPIIIAIVI